MGKINTYLSIGLLQVKINFLEKQTKYKRHEKNLSYYFYSICMYIYFAKEINRTFYGLTFHTSYKIVRWHLEKEKHNVLEEDQSIVMYDNVRIGGFNFDNATLSFYNDLWKSVVYSSGHINKDQAIDKFNTIKNALTLKYDMYVLKEDTDIIIFEDDRTGIILYWEYGESRGGKMFYYVTLSYYDKNLSDKQFQKEQDEL